MDALIASRELEHSYVGPEHILIGLVEEEDGFAGELDGWLFVFDRQLAVNEDVPRAGGPHHQRLRGRGPDVGEDGPELGGGGLELLDRIERHAVLAGLGLQALEAGHGVAGEHHADHRGGKADRAPVDRAAGLVPGARVDHVVRAHHEGDVAVWHFGIDLGNRSEDAPVYIPEGVMLEQIGIPKKIQFFLQQFGLGRPHSFKVFYWGI